ncbi:MAG: glycosyltransferase family 2 protein [Candidatus Shapirobacteria bacterium]
MTNNPLLSIIIISFNTCQITLDCLKSVFADKGLEFDLQKTNQNEKIPTEIIVVDNDSHDNSVKELQKLKNIIFIANKENSGFGKANNQAIKIAKGNYILLLNSDTIVLHSAISQSLNWLSAHPESHMCTAQLLNKDLSIQASGGSFPNLLNTIAWSLGLDDLPFFNSLIPAFHPHTPQFYTREKYFLKDHQQDWVTGAFMLIRRSIVDTTKGFDESYFMYGEEVEWAYRMHLALPKSQCWYLVGPQIIHLGGASAIKRSDPIVREYTGVLAFFTRHRPHWQTVVVKKILKINAFLRSLVIPIYKEVCSRI